MLATPGPLDNWDQGSCASVWAPATCGHLGSSLTGLGSVLDFTATHLRVTLVLDLTSINPPNTKRCLWPLSDKLIKGWLILQDGVSWSEHRMMYYVTDSHNSHNRIPRQFLENGRFIIWHIGTHISILLCQHSVMHFCHFHPGLI